VAGPIIRRLLAAGHEVHGTTRDLSRTHLLAPLYELEGAKERLRMFQADLTQPGDYDEPVKG
jgi:nucleoside-diphosphate-sugar epimerase